MVERAVGIDVGGTFTDLVEYDGRELRVRKVLSSPRRPERGFTEALKTIEASPSIVLHATTIGTNAFLGQKGLELPEVALVTTLGFRDAIEIGRQVRPQTYSLSPQKPEPLVPRRLRFEVKERTSPDGEIIVPVDEDELRRIARRISVEGVDVVVIAFLHAYANPANECKAKEILEEELDDVEVVCSHEVCNEYREYERTSTTLVNAVLRPIVTEYVERTWDVVRDAGASEYFLMQSDGYAVPAELTLHTPAKLIESGPAAGVVAARYLGETLGRNRLVSFDMGGTTAKAGTVVEGRYEVTKEYEVGGEVHRGRRIRGSGYPVLHRFIDLTECSAGGGTILWIDEAGALRVGPLSAGADPGPVCYGKGGTDPTITDANVVLGRLNRRALLGGEMPIDAEAADRALSELADELGLEPEEAAYQALRLAVEEMARIVRIVTVERGHDPREFSMVAFGGAGPLHAAELAEILEVEEVIVPLHPGVFSAYGLLAAEVAWEHVTPVMRTLEELDDEELRAVVRSTAENAAKRLPKEPDDVRIVVEARYRGQAHELEVQTGPDVTTDELDEAFHERHRAVHGFQLDAPVEIVNVRAIAVIERKPPEPSPLKKGGEGNPERALSGTREVYFKEEGYLETPVFDRNTLRAGDIIEGPAVIEQYDSTTLIPPGWEARVHESGAILLRRIE
ncbi:hydantoinase/oxoprolinase family protein [Methanopyrus sp.]